MTDDQVLERTISILRHRAPRETFTLKVICRVLGNLAIQIRQEAETAEWEQGKR